MQCDVVKSRFGILILLWDSEDPDLRLTSCKLSVVCDFILQIVLLKTLNFSFNRLGQISSLITLGHESDSLALSAFQQILASKVHGDLNILRRR